MWFCQAAVSDDKTFAEAAGPLIGSDVRIRKGCQAFDAWFMAALPAPATATVSKLPQTRSISVRRTGQFRSVARLLRS